MKFFIFLTLFIIVFLLVGPVLLIPVGLYLLVGMSIFFFGTRQPSGIGKSIVRRCLKGVMCKDELVDVALTVSASHILPGVEKGNPWNIVLVIDKSISMMGSPLANARIAAKNLISSTPPDFKYAIVEFQHDAYIRSPLTSDRIKLKLMLNRISAGGGTAIHEGLRLADQVLQQELGQEKNNAVILLSDGGSAQNPAHEEADAMKEKGVAIYAIGLGDCDQILMKQIASDEEKYFYARDAGELKHLYHTIGRMIQNARGLEVEVQEFPNVKKAPLKVYGWSDFQPYTFASGKDGNGLRVEWYLPALQEEAIKIDYQLKANCYGWHRVADGNAKLKMKNPQGEELSYDSNRGPYILIIPRFFLWQIFWIFLNPLFWIIFRKWKCKEDIEPPLKSYPPPEHTTIPQPELLPVLTPPFKLSVVPTLVLGAGFGGCQAVTHFKRLLWEHNQDDEVNGKVTCAVLDTVNPWFGDDVRSGHITLNPNEKINIHTPVSETIRMEADRREPNQDYIWLDASALQAAGVDYDTGFGTGMNRAIGRLMFLKQRGFLHGESDDGRSTLKSLLINLRDKNPNEPLQICITGTLSGGTAGGIIPELCYSVRKILDELNIPGVGINLFLMDFQVESDDTKRDDSKTMIQANRDALMNELARFFTARDVECSPLPGEPGIKRWFDRIIWVEKKQNTSNLYDLYPQCSMLMYSFAMEEKFRNLLQDNTQYIRHGLPAHCFESDAVFFFKRTLQEYYSVRLLLTTLGDHLLGLKHDPADYSEKSAVREPLLEYIDKALQALYNYSSWKNLRPLLLADEKMIKSPNPTNISSFLSISGLLKVVEKASEDKLSEFVNKEVTAFENLIALWVQCLMEPHQEKHIIATHDKKLPTTYFALEQLKENVIVICNIVENVPEKADYMLKKRCQTTAEMCRRFTAIIEDWVEKLRQWWVVLGNGNELLIGVCRTLNFRLNQLEKSLLAAKAFTTPHFIFDQKLQDEIYNKYFARLEHKVLEQIYWQVTGISAEESQREIDLLIVNNQLQNFAIQLDSPDLPVAILDVLTALPAYFASGENKWHEASIQDILALAQKNGQDVVADYFIPQVNKNIQMDILYLEPEIEKKMLREVSAGMKGVHLETKNPMVTGFYKYRLNQKKTSVKTQFVPAKLPAYVYPEEWNCYNALTVYSNLVDEEPLTPSYTVIALCRNMKKFMGAVYQGILEKQIQMVKGENRMLYTFHSLDAQISQDEDESLINMLRIIVESTEPQIENILMQGYNQLITINIKTLKTRFGNVRPLISHRLNDLLYQLSVGAVEYYRDNL
jgi:uncharacterized protein YegL